MSRVTLSLFRGIGMLDRAFERQGFCMVSGPDLLWGSDVRNFHIPSGVFWGIVGGPPCQPFSQLVHMVKQNGYEPRFGDLIPEFERIVFAGQPAWFLMENVVTAPIPDVKGYFSRDLVVDNYDVGGRQKRRRRFTFGTRNGQVLPISYESYIRAENSEYAVTADSRTRPVAMLAGEVPKSNSRRTGRIITLEEACELQGFPRQFLKHSPFTMKMKRQMVGEGVPAMMGEAVAKAVKQAMEI